MLVIVHYSMCICLLNITQVLLLQRVCKYTEHTVNLLRSFSLSTSVIDCLVFYLQRDGDDLLSADPTGVGDGHEGKWS